MSLVSGRSESSDESVNAYTSTQHPLIFVSAQAIQPINEGYCDNKEAAVGSEGMWCSRKLYHV